MANKFKNNKTGAETDSIFKGNWAIDTTASNIGGGPSSVTELYHGADIPPGGYTMYSPEGVYTTAIESDLLAKVKDLGGDYSSVSAALTWAASEPGVIILNKAFDNIVTDGLVLNLDASNISSFVDSQPTTNIHSPDAYGHNSGSYGNVVTVVDASSEKGAGWKKVTINNRGSNFRIIQWSYTGMSANITYWHSVEFDWGNMRGKGYFINFDGNGTGSRVYYHGNDFTTQGSTSITNIPDGRFSGSIIHTGSHNHAFFINNHSTGVSGINDYFYYKEFQVETTEYPTAYTSGTRLQNTGLYDLSVGDNHGTLTNGPTFNSNGWIEFDGTDSRINVTNPGISQQFTVSSWVYCTNVAGSNNIVSKNGPYFMRIVNSKVRFNVLAGSWLFQNGTTILTNNTWYNLTMTYDGSTWKGYINIVEEFSTPKTGTITSNASLHIGYTPVGGEQAGFNGNIAMVSIYNKALTADEVTQNFSAQRNRFGI